VEDARDARAAAEGAAFLQRPAPFLRARRAKLPIGPSGVAAPSIAPIEEPIWPPIEAPRRGPLAAAVLVFHFLF
jgi:hypothetical protein